MGRFGGVSGPVGVVRQKVTWFFVHDCNSASSGWMGCNILSDGVDTLSVRVILCLRACGGVIYYVTLHKEILSSTKTKRTNMIQKKEKEFKNETFL